MVCNSCGKEVFASEKFCTHCGATNNNVAENKTESDDEKKVVYVLREKNSTGNALLVVGILGIIFAILLPIVTYCISIPGLALGAKRPDKKGVVLNIIAIIIAVINSVLGIILQMNNVNV